MAEASRDQNPPSSDLIERSSIMNVKQRQPFPERYQLISAPPLAGLLQSPLGSAPKTGRSTVGEAEANGQDVWG